MIHSLEMKNWYKHHGRKFHFDAGLNMIRGENEAGKSLILEAVDYALHGSVALRLPVSMYDRNLSASLETTIRGVRYLIERTPKLAAMTEVETGKVIAAGIKAVDQEVRKLLGFNRNVFMVSNYSSQSSINQLSLLKPAERKKVIDNVVGLTAVEETIAEHKVELSALNKLLVGQKARLPESTLVEPTEPLPDDILLKLSELEERNKNTQHQLTSQETIKVTRDRLLAQQPELGVFNALEIEAMLITPTLTKAMAEQHEALLASKKSALTKYKGQVENEVAPTLLPEPDSSAIILDMTQTKRDQHDAEMKRIVGNLQGLSVEIKQLETLKESNTYYTQEVLKAIQQQEQLHADWKQAQQLKAKGSVTCKECGASTPIMVDNLTAYTHVLELELVEPPEVGHAAAEKSNQTLAELNQRLARAGADVSEQQKLKQCLEDNWYSEEALNAHFLTENQIEAWKESVKQLDSYNFRVGVLKDNCETLESEISQLETSWYGEKTLTDNFYALEQLEKRDKQVAAHQAWQDNFNSLPDYLGDDKITDLRQELEDSCALERKLLRLHAEWFNYSLSQKTYRIAFEEVDATQALITAEKNIIDTLQVYKSKIKSSILPSVNSVASAWVQRMSAGKHLSVELSEDMEILVNGLPIEALSISGRALGHLSLRMALGQVLTNSIYPVFMADEVDDSMRNERAQSVLDNLVKMLEGSVKQIIMISHRDLENVQNVIEV